MDETNLPAPDKNGIIRALPEDLSEQNRSRMNKFGAFMTLYDFFQDRMVRPRIHKADPERHHRLMHDLLSSVHYARILDVACGTGGLIPSIHRSNTYVGLDLSYTMLLQAIRKVARKSFLRWRLIQGNAEALLFGDEAFELVVMDTALHMIPKYREAVSEAARVLVEGGSLVCSTPAVGLDDAFDRGWARISGKRGLHSLSEEELAGVCGENGLEYTSVYTNGGVLYFKARKVPR